MDQQAAVVGFGQSGQAAARLLQRLGYAVTIWDQNESPALSVRAEAWETQGITVRLGENFLPTPTIQRVVVSPGVPWDMPFLEQARALGLWVQGEADLAWEVLGTVPWVGITGTNGKTTTTRLIEQIWTQAGWVAPACGNIGRPICDLALGTPPDWVIAELSSFQIEQSPQVRPEVALWTTFTPDHLNRHGSLEYYAQIKASLLDRAKKLVINGDDPYVGAQRGRWPEAVWTSTTDTAAPVHVFDGVVWSFGKRILPLTAIQVPGVHNIQNILMAVAAAHWAGIDRAVVAEAVAAFQGVPHRLEKIGVHQGVGFINDSKATNFEASLTGLAAMDHPVILLAGGQPKQGESGPWLAKIHEMALGVVLYGEAAPLFARLLHQSGYRAFIQCADLAEAVPVGFDWARQVGAGTVLLSPACASYDQFQNFEVRGEHFRQCFQGLTKAALTTAAQ